MYVAIAIAGIVPIAGAYIALLARWKNEPTFSDALMVTLSFLFVYVAMVVIHFNVGQFSASVMSFERMLSLSAWLVAVRFPFLVLSILFSVLALMVWRSDRARFALILIGLLMQALYFANLAIVLAGGEVIPL
jgi:hypothetical protein